MKRRGAMRSFFLRTAALAILFAALAPSISQALQDANPGWAFVCTPLGSQWMRVDSPGADRTAPAPDPAHIFEHCPYCSLHATGLGMPPATFAVQTLPLTYAVHWRYIAATPTLEFWSDALSRGPPQVA